jgi:hypothetical protein
MTRNMKHDMRKRARACMGLTDLLKDDIIQLRADLHDFDMMCLEESLKDAKSTMQMFIDNLTEIEYMLYLIKSKESL